MRVLQESQHHLVDFGSRLGLHPVPASIDVMNVRPRRDQREPIGEDALAAQGHAVERREAIAGRHVIL